MDVDPLLNGVFSKIVSSPRSLAYLPGAGRCPVTVLHRKEVVLVVSMKKLYTSKMLI